MTTSGLRLSDLSTVGSTALCPPQYRVDVCKGDEVAKASRGWICCAYVPNSSGVNVPMRGASASWMCLGGAVRSPNINATYALRNFSYGGAASQS